MEKLKKLSRKELETQFKITLPPLLTKEERQKCMQINALFDEVSNLYGVQEKALFENAYPENQKKAAQELSKFLHNVHRCPNEVIEHLQALLRAAQ